MYRATEKFFFGVTKTANYDYIPPEIGQNRLVFDLKLREDQKKGLSRNLD